MDHRGHGKSGHTPGHYINKDFVADVGAFLKRVVKKPTILVGHSGGAMAAIMATAQAPKSVTALIILDVPFIPEYETWIKWAKGVKHILVKSKELAQQKDKSVNELAKAFGEITLRVPDPDLPDPPPRFSDIVDAVTLMSRAKDLKMIDPEVYTPVFECFKSAEDYHRYYTGYNPTTMLPKITCPVLLIRGDPKKGSVVSDEAIRKAHELLPQLVHVTIKDVDHELGMSSWNIAPLLRAIMDFLEAI
jgi:pimeloyl-ACP methyl ester carboxylesterase